MSRRAHGFLPSPTVERGVSLPRDVLLFSIVLMLWAVQIEASGYGSSSDIVATSIRVAVVGLVGSALMSMRAAGRTTETDPGE